MGINNKSILTMYSNYKIEVYYLYDHYKNKYIKIGNYNDLIRFIANNVNTHGYSDPVRWSIHYIDEQNITGKDLKCILDIQYRYEGIEKKCLRGYSFYVNYGDEYLHGVDIRNYISRIA